LVFTINYDKSGRISKGRFLNKSKKKSRDLTKKKILSTACYLHSQNHYDVDYVDVNEAT